MTCTLYRFFDADDVLLYVGISISPLQRMTSHRAEKPWWLDISRARFEHFPSEVEARAAETAAIQAEHPVHNALISPDQVKYPPLDLPPWRYVREHAGEWITQAKAAELVGFSTATLLKRSVARTGPQMVRDERGRKMYDRHEVLAYAAYLRERTNRHIEAQLHAS